MVLDYTHEVILLGQVSPISGPQCNQRSPLVCGTAVAKSYHSAPQPLTFDPTLCQNVCWAALPPASLTPKGSYPDFTAEAVA